MTLHPSALAVVTVVYEQSDAEVTRFVEMVGSQDGGPYPIWTVVTKPGRHLRISGAHCHVVSLDENLGWTGGANVGAQLALAGGYGDLVFMNTDVTLLSPDLLSRLAVALHAHRGIGLVSPGIVTSPDHGRIWYRGATYSPWTWMTRHYGMTDHYEPTHTLIPTRVPTGCCLAVRGEAFEALGGFDAELFAYYDEADLAHRAAAIGWRTALVDSPLLAHEHSGRQLGRVAAYYMARNPFVLARKHSGLVRRVVILAAQLAAVPVYLVRCRGEGAAVAYLRGLSHGMAHLLGRPHVGEGGV